MVDINIALPPTTTKTRLLCKLQSAPISLTTNCINIAPHNLIKTEQDMDSEGTDQSTHGDSENPSIIGEQ